MPNTSDAGQPKVYIELLQLFEQARQLQTQSTQLLALARQDAGDVQYVTVS